MLKTGRNAETMKSVDALHVTVHPLAWWVQQFANHGTAERPFSCQLLDSKDGIFCTRA